MKQLKDVNWNHLYYFFEVGKAQSLKRAATELGLASSTLSTQLKSLEANFELKLFNRSSKGLVLTHEGVKLFDKVKEVFESGNKLLESYSVDTVGGYSVSIGIEETISHDLAAEFSSQYWDSYTQYGTVNTIRQADHSALVENITQGNIDWGISLKRPKRKNLNFSLIGSFEIVFCCSKELYEKFIDVKDILVNIPFVETSWDKNLNKVIYKHMRKNGVIPKEVICSDHTEFVQKLCSRGRCVTFLPQNPLEDYKDLQTFQIGEPLNISLYAIWKKEDEELVSVKALKNLLNSKLSSLPHRYEDVDFQIEVSDISNDKLE